MIKQEENGIYRVTTINPLAIILSALGMTFTLASWFVEGPDMLRNWIVFFIGVAGIAVGVWLFCKGRKLVAVLSTEGITLHASGVSSGGLIRWEEIESVVKERSSNKNIGYYVGFYFVDLDAYLARLSIVQRNNAKLSVTMGFPPVIISQQFLGDLDEFVELCNKFMKKTSE